MWLHLHIDYKKSTTSFQSLFLRSIDCQFRIRISHPTSNWSWQLSATFYIQGRHKRDRVTNNSITSVYSSKQGQFVKKLWTEVKNRYCMFHGDDSIIWTLSRWWSGTLCGSWTVSSSLLIWSSSHPANHKECATLKPLTWTGRQI